MNQKNRTKTEGSGSGLGSESGSEAKGTGGEGEAEEAERRLLESQKDNSYFSFLISEHPLHSHYQSLKTKLQTALLDSI
jgi:hypothetical protein